MPSASLPIDLRSVADARALLRAAVGQDGSGTPSQDLESAVLMVSELVTNAVRHGRSRLVLDISRSAGVLRVEVLDDGPGRPVVSAPDEDAGRGRGLQIVAALADDWGCVMTAVGKTVWFEIAWGADGRTD